MSFVEDLMGWILIAAFVVLSVSQLMAMARLIMGLIQATAFWHWIRWC